MPGHGVSIHFTETFLDSVSHILDEDDLRSIALSLATNPKAGTPVPQVPNLRFFVYASLRLKKSVDVWYLEFTDVPHLEIVGCSESGSVGTPKVANAVIWKIVKIGGALRLLYKAYDFISDYIR